MVDVRKVTQFNLSIIVVDVRKVLFIDFVFILFILIAGILDIRDYMK
jgi:hypothetical protein